MGISKYVFICTKSYNVITSVNVLHCICVVEKHLPKYLLFVVSACLL